MAERGERIEGSKPIECIEFHDYHRPSLLDGEYVLTATQQVKIAGQNEWTTPSGVLRFSVAGPRFGLDPGVIQSQFPPPKSIGKYDHVLPHIIFTRTTLPWERTIDNSTPSQAAQPTTWMALLLFDKKADADDLVPMTFTVQELLKRYGGEAKPATEPEFVKVLPRNYPGSAGKGELKLEIGQHLEDRVTVIDVRKGFLWQTLPSKDELKWLGHVRLGQDSADPTKSADYPVIFGNRLPAPGTESTVHLVSLEARQDLLDDLNTETAPADEDKRVRLVSLASWSFATLQNSKTFSGWINDAWSPKKQPDDPNVTHTLRMPVKIDGDKNAERFLADGYAPIRHQTRQGNHLVSWYRGPLLPGPSPAADADLLPVRTSDQLVRYFGDAGMFDVSYAAAWELGRMLTLRSKEVSVSLFNWKRAHCQQLHQAGAAVSHLPFAPDHAIPPDFPRQVRDWFRELLHLEHVPFHYLVPREDMLPKGTLRFFQVDPTWLECLLDGAFSVGRVTSGDIERDRTVDHRPKTAGPGYSGFLLRSPVVTGWPHLGVEAYARAIPEREKPPWGPPATRVRFDRLGEDILLCVFEGDMKTFDIHEHPEALHFGVDADYRKGVRRPDGSEGDKIKVCWKHGSDARRTLDIAKLAHDAGAKSSAAFAMAMIEGVELVRFVKQS